jgi:formiminotetrahydrofolate cyclodeaminase
VDIEEYIGALASEEPTPGGGSAATLVTALGAALVAMVARLTQNNAKYAEHHALAADLVTKADGVRARALVARTQDEAAYQTVVNATALPKGTSEERSARTAAVQSALGGAARAPLEAAELAKLVAILAARALELENVHLASDLGCAAEFAQAALAAAALNVRVNHKYMKDRAAIDAGERLLRRYEAEVAPLIKRVRFEVARALAL